MLDTLPASDAVLRSLAAEAGCALAAVRYRLAPEHPFPVPLEDVLDAIRRLAARAIDLGLEPYDPALIEGHVLTAQRLGELLDIERRATAGALARRGRPNMTLTIDRVDAFHLGALFMFLELATAYAGRLYGVNAFDQPGVELGKQFTYAMLGRADAGQARQEWELLPKPDPKRIL